MAVKTLTTRVQQKSDTSANWAKATNFTPLKGEIIVYTDLKRFKIGDGVTKVNDLKFADENVVTKATFSNGTFSFKNAENEEQFTVNLPIYNGEEL